ncbi:hypothetical protein BDF19DRAFT_435534 [Syncephalis fuscata]|nr:hypothetical protein BDF19DRAFT_435534 [Syncephalis fuscata]
MSIGAAQLYSRLVALQNKHMSHASMVRHANSTTKYLLYNNTCYKHCFIRKKRKWAILLSDKDF